MAYEKGVCETCGCIWRAFQGVQEKAGQGDTEETLSGSNPDNDCQGRPRKFLKAIEGRTGLFEIRIEHGRNTYRVFCRFDEDKLVILFNGFQKKAQKTPKDQLDKAEALMKKYFELKTKHHNG